MCRNNIINVWERVTESAFDNNGQASYRDYYHARHNMYDAIYEDILRLLPGFSLFLVVDWIFYLKY